MNDNCDDEEVLGRYTIEVEMREYADILAPGWCGEFAAALSEAPAIEKIGKDLILQWRAATRVADFPAVMMSMFSKFAESSLRTQPPANMLPMLAEAWENAFLSHAPAFAKGPLFRKATQATRAEAKTKVEAAARRALEMVSADAIWNQYLAEPAFRFRVWSTMQVCTVAIYNAYDGFLAACTEGEEGRRVSDRLTSRYGQQMYVQLFQSRDIQIARELRHAVSHNRGRMTEKLERLDSGLDCHDGLISIYPRDIRRYLAAMGRAAMALSQHVATDKPASG